MLLAFSTLGCPDWPLEHIARRAVEYGYDGVEIRGIQEHVDLRLSPHFSKSRIAETRALFRDSGLGICCLGSSASFADPARSADSDAEARAYMDIAAELGCPLVRVFGGRSEEPDAASRVADALRKLAPFAVEHGVSMVLETHDAFSTGRAVAEVLSLVSHASIGALWDLHHPYREGESPDETAMMLAPFVMHTHVKDSLNGDYCLLGEGDVPIKQMIQRLPVKPGLWISLEWEKRWHPEIAAPETAFPQYAAELKKYLLETR